MRRSSRFVVGVALGAIAAVAPAAAGPGDLIGQTLASPDGRDPGHAPPPQPMTLARNYTDQPDIYPSGVRQTHLLYFVPRDQPDRALDINGIIPRSIDAVRAWFSARMGRTPRIDRISATLYDVTFVAGLRDAAEYRLLNDVVNEIDDRFAAPNKRYFIYAEIDRGTVCGEGYYPLAPDLDTGRYAAIYLHSDPTCGGAVVGNGTAEATVGHEWLHNEGVVPLGAPHHCLLVMHVCTGPLAVVPDLDPESPDVMFPFVTGPLQDKLLDRGRDDYLDHPWPYRNLRDSPWLE